MVCSVNIYAAQVLFHHKAELIRVQAATLVHFSPVKSSGRLAHDIRYTHFCQTDQPYSLHNYYVSETWSKNGLFTWGP